MEIAWWIFAVLVTGSVISEGVSVKNVPYHRQITEFSCGDASMEMLLHWSGMDVDQRAIMDALRTGPHAGTLSFDIVRGAHFSSLSHSEYPGLYPPFAPSNGWSPMRPLGLASFSRRDTTCWLDGVRSTLDLGLPLVALMHYDGSKQHDGHFRVLVGYTGNGDSEMFTMLDPWDRAMGDGPTQPRVFTVNASEMCRLWNYSEANGNVTYKPYFAAVGAPWSISLEYSEDSAASVLNIATTLSYTCPPAFADAAVGMEAVSASATITLPPSLTLSASNKTSVPLGTMVPGQSATLVWQAVSDDSMPKGTVPTVITVEVAGIVSAVVPYTYWGNGTYVPGYQYRDLIGGRATVAY